MTRGYRQRLDKAPAHRNEPPHKWANRPPQTVRVDADLLQKLLVQSPGLVVAGLPLGWGRLQMRPPRGSPCACTPSVWEGIMWGGGSGLSARSSADPCKCIAVNGSPPGRLWNGRGLHSRAVRDCWLSKSLQVQHGACAGGWREPIIPAADQGSGDKLMAGLLHRSKQPPLNRSIVNARRLSNQRAHALVGT